MNMNLTEPMSTHTDTFALALLLSTLSTLSAAQQPAPGIIGKDGWLFYNHEFVRDTAQANVSVDLIAKVSKALESQGTKLVVAMAPAKARIYAEHLPPSHPLKADHEADYNRLLHRLQAAGVATADINAAFLSSPKRNGDAPLYFRQDTHWSATGALLAAETIRDSLNATPTLQQIFNGTSATPYSLTWATQKFPFTGDLIQQLPPGAPKFEKEMISAFEVRRENAQNNLLGDVAASGIALLGSSYSAEWTHFPKALNYVLQRDVPAIAVTADRGQWVGLDTYLRNDAFQANRPKLLIWEMPERDMKAPPNMPYREARYVFDNDEWLVRVVALIDRSCSASGNHVNTSGKLAKGSTFEALTTTPSDTAELTLSRPTNNREYLSGVLTAQGSKNITIDLSGPGAPPRQITLEIAGDGQPRTFKIPLYTKSKGYSKVKLMPGNTTGFSLKDIVVCQLPPL